MHSVSESAISLREWKKVETSHRITLCAQRLTEQHGLDGFTMEDLAEAAGVSRRTLFNYYPSKIDAVLGAAPELPDEVTTRFRDGGPHGDLLEDLAELARAALAVKRPDRDSVELGRRVLASEPRLLAAAHQRFEAITLEFTDAVLEREGSGFDPNRARLLLRMLLAVLDHALGVLVDDDRGRTLAEVFDEELALARELFA
jgi:AcrR family transcriptional regulator